MSQHFTTSDDEFIPDPSPWKLATVFGLAGAFLQVGLLMLQVDVLDAISSIPLSVVFGILPFLIVLPIGLINYRRKLNGFMSFKQAAGFAAACGGIIAIVGAVLMLIYMLYINPSFIDDLMASTLDMMDQLNPEDTPPEAVEMQKNMMGWFVNPYVMFFSNIINSFIYALIVGLISAAIMQKTRA